MFTKLPGVGPGTARRWWEQGFRSLEDVEEAAGLRDAGEPGSTARTGGAPLQLSVDQRFSLLHRAELLEGATPAEMAEMQQVLASALASVSGVREGWRIEVVGGTARQRRPPGEAPQLAAPAAAAAEQVVHHDCDFLCWHPTAPLEGLVQRLHAHLIAQGRVVQPAEAMSQVQVDPGGVDPAEGVVLGWDCGIGTCRRDVPGPGVVGGSDGVILGRH